MVLQVLTGYSLVSRQMGRIGSVLKDEYRAGSDSLARYFVLYLNEVVGAEGEEPQGHGELDKEQDVVGDIVEAAAVDLQDGGLSAVVLQ